MRWTTLVSGRGGPGLAEHLAGWRSRLSDDERRGPAQRLFLFLLCNRTMLVFYAVFELKSFLDVLRAETAGRARVPIRSFIGCARAGMSLEMMARRRHVAREAFALAASIAATLENDPAWPDDRALAGRRHTARIALLHGRVKEVARLLSQFYGYLLVGYHAGGLLLPIISTVEVIVGRGRADSFALTVVPHVFIFFVSQAVFAQRLETSSEDVGWAAYEASNGRKQTLRLDIGNVFGCCSSRAVQVVMGIDILAVRIWNFRLHCQKKKHHGIWYGKVCFSLAQGPWLAESTPSRRARLIVVQSATRPSRFGVPGLIFLNHVSCLRALRTWFQYAQILLNVDEVRSGA
ncbi:putative cytochrome P450 6a17 [Frankliniella fusca]|uniref:Cytochrome P450 6a17 n=1 Tax=Frankliniella fusca TaxID=407009 RepID=A0AAE1HIA2_9NEOP|nr:putative cytochrome P450 6a17 [Frankliniella fusca]